jgi:hypothetical protein
VASCDALELKIGSTSPRSPKGRVSSLISSHPSLKAIADVLPAARRMLARECRGFERRLREIARDDAPS